MNRNPPVAIGSMRVSLSADKDRERNADNHTRDGDGKGLEFHGNRVIISLTPSTMVLLTVFDRGKGFHWLETRRIVLFMIVR